MRSENKWIRRRCGHFASITTNYKITFGNQAACCTLYHAVKIYWFKNSSPLSRSEHREPWRGKKYQVDYSIVQSQLTMIGFFSVFKSFIRLLALPGLYFASYGPCWVLSLLWYSKNCCLIALRFSDALALSYTFISSHCLLALWLTRPSLLRISDSNRSVIDHTVP